MENIIIIIILLLIILAIYFAFIWSKRSKKLSSDKIKDFQKKLSIIKNSSSSKEKLIDSDKLYHKILQEIWYKWDFWSILKQKPIIIWDLSKIWELHKIRNKLVHDFEEHNESFLPSKSKEFIQEIEKLIKNLS